jgi:histidine ammonia-lyase
LQPHFLAFQLSIYTTMLHQINNDYLHFEQVNNIIKNNYQLALDPAVAQKVAECHNYLTGKIQHSEAAFYGINTGFGNLCNVSIDRGDLLTLQRNLILSHSCGMGDEVPTDIVRIMHLLKIKALSMGHSGVSNLLIDYLIRFYNEGVVPVVYTQGSLGASGDLAPLAHFSLPLLGEGYVYYKGTKRTAAEVLKLLDTPPYTPVAKEGLALINGTQFMLAYGVWCLRKAFTLYNMANQVGALSADVFLCKREPFHPAIQRVRPHSGQIQVAEKLLALLDSSTLEHVPSTAVQDPYSFRCMPQVHGATFDTLSYVKTVLENEINSVTDNPLVFPEEDTILSGGNFHGQPIALVLEFMGLAIHELASISERRTFHLLSGKRSLPEFLTPAPGLNSGLMIPQYLAAGLVNQNKMYCYPVTADTIVTSNGQEDHVSMGANAATKCYQIIQNVEKVLAIELMAATQALECRRPHKSGPILEQLVAAYREKVAPLTHDRLMKTDLDASVEFVQNYDWSV